MTGNSTSAGHSVSIPLALYSHRKAIDQDMTGAVCFSVCFDSYFCWKTLFALIMRLEAASLSPDGLGQNTLSSDKQSGRKYPLMNYQQQVQTTYQQREPEEQDLIKCCLSGDRQWFFRPQVGAGSYELILFRLIIICQAVRHLDICFERRWPERTAQRQLAECVIIRSVNKASGLSSITSVRQREQCLCCS